MSNAICVADVQAGVGVSRGVFSTSMPTDGCPAVLVVNLGQVKTLAQLNSALAALPTYSLAEHGGTALHAGTSMRPPRQNERTRPSIGPFDAAGGQPSPDVLSFSYQPGWTAANVAASMRQFPLGRIGGPHAVALIVNHEKPGGDVGQSVLRAGAVAALTGVLP